MAELLDRLQSALGDTYRVERELGGGGMSHVFVARDVELGRAVVVKVLPPELGAGVNQERFRREIQLAASLQHPHIVPLLTAGHRDDLTYYTMPLIEGESLRARLAKSGELPVPEVVRILRDVVDALAYAHENGVVHRDIKPDNVLLSRQHALVTDFGVAKAISQATGPAAITSVGVALGTPAYMAPEQVTADPNIDQRCDLYAVGVLGYEMLTGHVPFFTANVQQMLAAQLTEAPEPVAKRRPAVPAALEVLIMRCLEKSPSDRWQSAQELVGQLEAMVTPGGETLRAMVPARGAPARARMAWRKWLVTGAAVLALGGLWSAWHARADSGRSTSPTVIAVLPFSVRGSDQYRYLGEGIVDLLSTSLDGAGGWRSVNAHSLLSYVALDRSGELSSERARAVADRFGAGLYALGDILEVNGRLHVSASLFDMEHAAQPITEATVDGDAAEVFQLVDQLAARLAAARSAGTGTRLARIAATTTASLPALKAYLAGERAYRAGQYTAAVDSFREAVAADTAFALAFYRLSMAQERLVWADESRRSAEQAYRHSSRLSPHDRQFLEAVLAVRRGSAGEAEQLFRAIVGTYPDDADAWYQLGELSFHGRPLHGGSMTEAVQPFNRALFFDPSDLGSLYHLIRIAARDRNRAQLDSLAARFLALSPSGERSLEVRALQALTVGDQTAQDRVVADLERAADNTLPLVVWSVGAFTHNIRGAERIARLMLEPARSMDVQGLGHLLVAHLELALGRRRSAEAELRLAEVLGEPGARAAAAWFAALPFVPESRPALDSARADLRRWNVAAMPRSQRPSAFFSAHNTVYALLRAYLLGLVSARLGDAGAAFGYARELEDGAATAAAPGLARDLAYGVRAQAALAASHPADALAEIEKTRVGGWYELTFASPYYAGALERWTRAELLWGAGRSQEALGWYGGLGDNTVQELVFLGPSLLRRAEIQEQLGRRSEATELYKQFVDLWRDCDVELRPMVEDASARLARMTGQETR